MAKETNNTSANKAKTNSQGGRYIFRGICALLLNFIAALSFLYVWIDYVQHTNRTGYLLGKGNIAMSVIIYVMM
ncbi:MAG: hypothetical protein IKT10_02435, partial [Clostridiales bacterium]|nr:hypothetical protein [Clostridiales bacterium]